MSTLLHALHINLDPSTAGEADAPGGLVGDPELEQPRLAVLDHVHRFGDDRALDAAARNRAQEVPLLIHDKMAAGWARGRAPRLNDGRESDAAALLPPSLGLIENIG